MGAFDAQPAPLVSVIVPTLDGGQSLLDCLGSIPRETELQTEIILVDNASSDGSPLRAGELFSGVHVIRNDENRGFSIACNQGASIAQGEFLLFLNDDARLAEGYLEQLVRSAKKGVFQVLQPLLLSEEQTVDSAGDLFTPTGFLWHQTDHASRTEAFPVFAVKGACVLIRRDHFEKLGGFCESYFAYFEESDFCWRARMAGYEIGVDPLAKTLHGGGRTTRRVFRPEQIYYLSFRNRFRSILANPSAGSVLKIAPLHVTGCLASAAVFALSARIRVAVSILQAIAWPAWHFGTLMEQRRGAQSLRKLSDIEVLRADLTEKLSIRKTLTLLGGTLLRWPGRR